MCGIAGIVRLDGSSPDPERLRQMAFQLAHRGPDDERIWIDGPVGFAHRRLAIIDVAGSPQPMRSADGRLTLVFNGEILNYRELRRRIDYPWTTDGDTEVLLALHALEGEDAVQQLRGQFAYAIHDALSGDVTLFRDRLGIVPLYFAANADEILFASEPKAILAVSPGAGAVDQDQLDAYLAGRSVPAPNTLCRGIKKLLPGHLLRVSGGRLGDAVPYWTPPPSDEVLARRRTEGDSAPS